MVNNTKMLLCCRKRFRGQEELGGFALGSRDNIAEKANATKFVYYMEQVQTTY